MGSYRVALGYGHQGLMQGEIRARGGHSKAGILHVCRCVCEYVDFIKIFLINKGKNCLQGCWCDWQHVSVLAVKSGFVEDPVGL